MIRAHDGGTDGGKPMRNEQSLVTDLAFKPDLDTEEAVHVLTGDNSLALINNFFIAGRHSTEEHNLGPV